MNGIRNHFTRTVLTSAAMLFLSTGVMAAQHSFTPEEVADGGRIYGASCASCHGPRGDGVSGAPIMSGNFKRASSDDDLIKLLRNGIPNTTMQAQRDLSETQAGTVIAYLRLMALSSNSAGAPAVAVPTLPPGDVVAGKLLNADTFAIQVFDSKEKLVTYQKSNLKDYSFVSPMPSYRDKLTPQELSDVITYLISLKGS